MRIGVFGGSFDPVHRGHLALARQAVERLRLDEVRFVPARAQPLKTAGHGASPEDRVAMLHAALDGDPRFLVDPREIGRPGPSYTVDTLRELKLERPADELFLLLGADAARELPRWRDAGSVARVATVVVVPRPGVTVPALPAGSVQLETESVDVSATGIRGAVARGDAIGGLVPPAVARYITAHGLYRTGA